MLVVTVKGSSGISCIIITGEKMNVILLELE